MEYILCVYTYRDILALGMWVRMHIHVHSHYQSMVVYM